MESTASGSAPLSMWRDWRYYSKWWCIWTVALFELQVLGILQERAHSTSAFLLGQASVALGGAVLALIPSTLFTLMQNGMNQGRHRWRAWCFAIAAYAVCAIVFALIVIPYRQSPY